MEDQKNGGKEMEDQKMGGRDGLPKKWIHPPQGALGTVPK